MISLNGWSSKTEFTALNLKSLVVFIECPSAPLPVIRQLQLNSKRERLWEPSRNPSFHGSIQSPTFIFLVNPYDFSNGPRSYRHCIDSQSRQGSDNGKEGENSPYPLNYQSQFVKNSCRQRRVAVKNLK